MKTEGSINIVRITHQSDHSRCICDGRLFLAGWTPRLWVLFWILIAKRAIFGEFDVELLLSVVAFALGWVALFACVLHALVVSIAAALGVCRSCCHPPRSLRTQNRFRTKCMVRWLGKSPGATSVAPMHLRLILPQSAAVCRMSLLTKCLRPVPRELAADAPTGRGRR